MTEILRDTIQKDEATLADPIASPEQKQYAYLDRAISRRLVSKGIETLEDDPK